MLNRQKEYFQVIEASKLESYIYGVLFVTWKKNDYEIQLV